MKSLIVVLALMGTVAPALAGGLTEPAMDPAVVVADTASSSSDNWVGIVMSMLVIGVAIAQ